MIVAPPLDPLLDAPLDPLLDAPLLDALLVAHAGTVQPWLQVPNPWKQLVHVASGWPQAERQLVSLQPHFWVHVMYVEHLPPLKSPLL